MRLFAMTITVITGLAAAGWSASLFAQNERDFVFTDDEGHLVLRFAGSGPGGPDAHELEEVVNQSFSTMVHDQLRADLIFGAEPIDSEWARSMEPRIRSHLTSLDDRFSMIDVECRSMTCRVVMEETERLDVEQHQALMDIVQSALEPLTGKGRSHFDPVFLIAAYEQLFETPQIKAYLKRATAPD
jgi:hypothetical protein